MYAVSAAPAYQAGNNPDYQSEGDGMSKYGHRTLDWFEAVVNKIGGDDMAERFLRGELIVTVPNQALFPVWKTIRLGTGIKNADGFRTALKKAGMKIGDWGNDILGKPAFTVSKTEMDVDLVNVSVAELGFKDGATRRDIIAKALSLGLELVPAEVGPQLRLQYADQPKGEWLLVGMEPITDSGGDQIVFDVGHDDDERWLNGDNGYPDDFWGGLSRFVFVRRK